MDGSVSPLKTMSGHVFFFIVTPNVQILDHYSARWSSF
jgi:hypothetical protein